MSKEPKYEKKARMVMHKIMEVSKATKRKPGFLKIEIDDELAENLMVDKIRYYDPRHDFNVTALTLVWEQKK